MAGSFKPLAMWGNSSNHVENNVVVTAIVAGVTRINTINRSTSTSRYLLNNMLNEPSYRSL